MAVPPIERSPDTAPSGARLARLSDLVLGLLIVAALPLAIVAIPNTVSVVAELLPDRIDRIGLMRAHGLALPAMMLTVPLAAVAMRWTKPAHLLLGGLVLLAVADAAGGYAGSAFLVGVLRAAHGVGAGLVVPALLVAAWERPHALRALWTGMLSLSLLGAQALALWPLDGVTRWQITLQPYPLLTGITLALAAVYLVLWLAGGRSATPIPRPRERSRLLLSTVPAAGIAVMAISTASEDWRAGLVILLAVLAVVGLLGLASIGTRESRTLAYAMVAVGVVLLPSVAQVTYVEMGGLGGPGLKGLWVPFSVAGLLAVAAAVMVRVFAVDSRWATRFGLLSMVAGLCSVRVVAPSPEGMVLVVPFALLAVGASVALTAALSQVGMGTAMFGLALCFPGVLAGYLLGTGVQMTVLKDVTSAQELVDSFVHALHLWALLGGFFVVAVIVLAAVMSRRAPVTADGPDAVADRERVEPPADSDPEVGDLDGPTAALPRVAAAGPDDLSDVGSGAGDLSGSGAGKSAEAGSRAGRFPDRSDASHDASPVPSPMRSPEDETPA